MGEGNRRGAVSLTDVRSWMSGEPFMPPPVLYHLTTRRNLEAILADGLKPRRPRSKISNEGFAGIWLTDLEEKSDIVDTHFLPPRFYDTGVVVAVDSSFLVGERFVIGIELPVGMAGEILSGEKKISRSDYLAYRREIIYLDAIPPQALSLADTCDRSFRF